MARKLMKIPERQIPPERKTFYYVGMTLNVIGVLMFLSTFVTFMANFGNFNNFEARARSDGFRAFGGIALIMVGQIIMNIGARGWAGAGVILDPDQARKDVEPWSRMSGGVLQDTLSEVEVVKKLEDRLEPPEPQIKVRCRQCQSLNDESAKFCNQCGSVL
jgi:hypothetical protein